MSLVYGYIDATGIHVQSRTAILADLVAAFNTIYGTSLDAADSSNPDVQWLQSITQAAVDGLDLDVQVYNGMDPDLAIGFVLDQRVAINGLQRLGGTYTLQNISMVITDQISQSLRGLDDFPDDPYIIADNAGNQWMLLETQNPAVAGTYVYVFRSAIPGAIFSAVNSIQTQVTPVIGVTSVNNPSTYSSLGVTQETDAKLRVRRQKSVALPSQGFQEGLVAALENINGITSAQVAENDTGTTDSDGIPGHCIWCIIAGAAVDGESLIAEAIYLKRGAGCNMKGSETYNWIQRDGTVKVIRWDYVTPEDLYIQLHVASLDGIVAPNVAAISAGLVAGVNAFTPGVGAEVNITTLSTLVQAIDPNCYVVPTAGDGFSLTAGSYTPTLNPSAKNFQFAVAAIRINLVIV